MIMQMSKLRHLLDTQNGNYLSGRWFQKNLNISRLRPYCTEQTAYKTLLTYLIHNKKKSFQ